MQVLQLARASGLLADHVNATHVPFNVVVGANGLRIRSRGRPSTSPSVEEWHSAPMEVLEANDEVDARGGEEGSFKEMTVENKPTATLFETCPNSLYRYLTSSLETARETTKLKKRRKRGTTNLKEH
eukprot:GHVT01043637.1.p1 GENE.GHVT01043637.1~~GHVT01043637.1.p1  ORF type:complete len:127 (+),score=13.31 GHVT01043637.1:1072-1452(+)